MKRYLAVFSLSLLVGILPARAEFQQIDLTIFGMD